MMKPYVFIIQGDIMKCHCYETETDFILCVEDVNNIQLEDVIQHAWFEKHDNKFIKAIPITNNDNGITKEDKELIRYNFSHLGQSMFEGMLDCKWENALILFTQKCDEHGIEWYIFGSISDVIRGIDIKPHDIDIFIHTKDFFKLKNAFSDFIVEPFVDYNGTWLVRFFGRLCFSGVLFDIASDNKMNLENHNYDKVLWNGYNLYVENFQARYQLELKRNRGDRLKAMQEYMLKHKIKPC